MLHASQLQVCFKQGLDLCKGFEIQVLHVQLLRVPLPISSPAGHTAPLNALLGCKRSLGH